MGVDYRDCRSGAFGGVDLGGCRIIHSPGDKRWAGCIYCAQCLILDRAFDQEHKEDGGADDGEVVQEMCGHRSDERLAQRIAVGARVGNWERRDPNLPARRVAQEPFVRVHG